jgi:hypothetical protein
MANEKKNTTTNINNNYNSLLISVQTNSLVDNYKERMSNQNSTQTKITITKKVKEN